MFFMATAAPIGRRAWFSLRLYVQYINKIVIGVLGASKNTFYGQFSNILKFKMKIWEE